MQIELIDLQNEVGITFVYVTHDQTEALALSHRIAVMNKGGSSRSTNPRSLYGFPTTRFVADFIGTCNLLDGVDRVELRRHRRASRSPDWARPRGSARRPPRSARRHDRACARKRSACRCAAASAAADSPGQSLPRHRHRIPLRGRRDRCTSSDAREDRSSRRCSPTRARAREILRSRRCGASWVGRRRRPLHDGRELAGRPVSSDS